MSVVSEDTKTKILDENKNYVNYRNIVVKPHDLFMLIEFEVIEEVNEHSIMKLTGIIDEKYKTTYAESNHIPVEVSACFEEEEAISIFKGVVTKVEVIAIKERYELKLEAHSYSYLLDIKKISRTFQDLNITYRDLVKSLASGYDKADIGIALDCNIPINKFIMQFEETDWEFLKRMASRFSSPIIPETTQVDAKAYFGIPIRERYEDLSDRRFIIQKNLEKYKRINENEIISQLITSPFNTGGWHESDFIYYTLEEPTIMNIGDEINFKNRTLYIKSITRIIQNSVLINKYVLCTKKGLCHPKIYNEKIVGLSINGTIIDVKNDIVKLWFDIDPSQSKEKACWFFYSTNYTTGGNAGFYCMPELYEKARIYFPTKKEEDGVAQSSVRQTFVEAPNRGNPDIKYLRSKSGKELRLYPGGVLIVAQDDSSYINIKDCSVEGGGNIGIEIVCLDKDIQLKTAKNILLEAGKKINISAVDEIKTEIIESDTYISLLGADGDKIEIKSLEIHSNN